MNEEKILRGLKNQRRSSLEKAIAIYSPYVNVIVYNIIGGAMSKEDIEEAVADVFISLWNNAGYINEQKGSLRSYIGAIARNKAKNKLREISIHAEINDNTVSDCKSPENEVVENEFGRMLYECIMALGEPDSEIMLRYYYNNEKIREISQAMDINISTIKTKLKRGRQRLKQLLSEKEGRL